MNRNLRYVAFIDILGFRNIVKQFKGRVADLGTELPNIFRADIFAALTGENVIPKPKNMTVRVSIYRGEPRDRDLYFKEGTPLRVKASEVKHISIRVYLPGKPESVFSYAYGEIPNLTRVITMLK
ncbi:hypothetical protein [Brevibacillus brevis]|uniref:hypothetical protein n=1 Tax=Brevibacillus brevis TaxID=1393 RepID=UPI0025A63D08|nr:hypothetical protein [Brevibacillus brevis]WJQ78958.1 hypothetical protein QN310_15695 [Brevibacillus brevis]